MAEKENIKTFVQQTLGCGCPEEVFRDIDCRSDVQLNDLMVNRRINIGNRLLIYIVEIKGSDSLERDIVLLIDDGRRERDSLGFNRFRLVLAADNTDGIKKTAEEIFAGIDKDEKIHLHIITKKSIPFL